MIGFVLACLMSPALAMDVEVYTTYQSYESEVGESMDDFALRVSPYVYQITQDTGFEACAIIAKHEDGRFGVTLTSSHSYIGCVLRSDIVPEGFSPTEFSIHSHPDASTPRQKASPMDAQLNKAMGQSTSSRAQGHARKGLARPSGFSPADFDAGFGYLVTAKTVLFQEGRGTVRRVGRF